jgi:uncharacterized membrane protein YqaE (UPF0057 family)
MIQKRRYTKGFNLNIKKPAVDKANEEQQQVNMNDEQVLVQAATIDNKPVMIEGTDNELKSDKQNELELASTELSSTLLSDRATNESSEMTEPASAAPAPVSEAFPLNINNNSTSRSDFSAPAALATDGEVTILIIILTILLPPLGVALVFGIGTEFWISLLLTLLFYFPGLIYSLIVIL